MVYVNSDDNARGFLSAEGSHVLEHFINDVARDIQDPETKLTVWKRKQAKAIDEAKPEEKKEELKKSKASKKPLSSEKSASESTPANPQ